MAKIYSDLKEMPNYKLPARNNIFSDPFEAIYEVLKEALTRAMFDNIVPK